MDKTCCVQNSYDKKVLTTISINHICFERQGKGDYDCTCEMHLRLWSKRQEGLECLRDLEVTFWEKRENPVYKKRKEKLQGHLILTLVHWKIAKQSHFDNDVTLRVVKIYSPQHLRTNSLIIVRYRMGLDRFMMTFPFPLHCV